MALKYKYLEEKAKAIRRTIVGLIHRAKCSHVGCSLSVADILAALYFEILKLDPNRPDDPDRDKLILSKGHAVSALYATLVERGFFSKEKLDEYGTDGTMLASHVVHRAVPGAETSNGSGGHGLSLGIGMALAARDDKRSSRVYVVSGDGEMEEGSVWEALLFAGFHKISNLTFIIDRNFMKSEGSTASIIDIEPLPEKLRAFRWEVDVVDGHDFDALISVFQKKHDKPHAVVAVTIKGKGVSYMEGKWQWHGGSPNKEQYDIAMKELA
jgi:transketolase